MDSKGVENPLSDLDGVANSVNTENSIVSHFTITTPGPPNEKETEKADADGQFDRKTVLFLITVAVLCLILFIVCLVFLWRIFGPPSRAAGNTHQSNAGGGGVGGATTLEDAEHQLRQQLHRLEASASSRKPSDMSYSITSNRNGSVIAMANTSGDGGGNPLSCGVRMNRSAFEEDIDDDGKSKLPCLNCRLIQMGSAITYGDNRCPQCGRDTFGQ